MHGYKQHGYTNKLPDLTSMTQPAPPYQNFHGKAYAPGYNDRYEPRQPPRSLLSRYSVKESYRTLSQSDGIKGVEELYARAQSQCHQHPFDPHTHVMLQVYDTAISVYLQGLNLSL